MKRVLVIGSPGSGKSTFARALRDRTGLPLVYLDQMNWNADKTFVAGEVLRQRIREAAACPEWIIDGHYAGTLPMRLEQCDTVFFLDYPLEVCLAGIRARVGAVREDMPWVETELDADFMAYIRQFHAEQLPELYALLDQYPNVKRYWFTDRTQAQEYLDSLKENQL